jgi:tRNA G10  N-methylase Trm11
MRTVIQMANRQTIELPERFRKDDVRYPDDLVRYFVEMLSAEGDIVVDPFAGFGTTLRVCQEMNRVGYGVEFDADRCEYARSLLRHPERLLNADSTRFDSLSIPQFKLCITSPPYMGKTHTENPFTSYSTIGGGYGQYLRDIKSIYAQVKSRMLPGAHVVIEVSNLKHDDGTITTLAWDIANAVSEVLSFRGEVVISWEPTYAYGYDHSYCLLFS